MAQEATPSDSCSDLAGDGCERQDIVLERTLAIVKPDAIKKCKEIEDVILRNGFTILERRFVQLTPEQASEFYAEHFGKLFFPSLIGYMTSGPVVVMMLARLNAVKAWNHLIGPKDVVAAREREPNSLRARFGTDEQQNAVHGSETEEVAARELRFFFSNAVVEPISKGELAKDYLAKAVNPTLLKGLTALCKRKPENPARWLSDWLINNNPYKAPIKETPEVFVIEEY